MAVTRPLSFFLSVFLAAGLWFYGAARLQTNGGGQGVYATLVCGGAYTDREIRGRLDSQGLTGLVSESDQWFLLDCFGYIEKIPLADYEERLLPFDPRNDGYAQKLKNFFVRDGKRFIYIPLAQNHPESLEMKIAGALTGIPYSLEYARSSGQNIFFPLAVFLMASCAFFVIPFLRRRLDTGLLPCLPALSPLALGGAPGFALASLLAGFAALIADGKTPAFSRLGQGLPEPFTSRRLPALAFIACYGFLSLLSGIPFFFTFLVFVFFCCALAVSWISIGSINSISDTGEKPRTRHKRTPKNRRFVPVEILNRGNVIYKISPVMLPFAAAALVLALVGFAKPPPLPSPVTGAPSAKLSPLPAGAVSEADFKEHFFFQYTFSFIALGKPYEAAGGLPAGNLPTGKLLSGNLPAIAGYDLSSNGLLVPAVPGIDNEPPQIPDFPLGDLLRALSSPPPRAPARRGNSAHVDLILALPPLLFILPAFISRARNKKSRN